LTGVLLEHGKAPHQHDPEQEPSYFVRLRTNRSGEREIWGVDLERAIRQSLTGVQVGDRVGLRTIARQDFTLDKDRRDEHGRARSVPVQAHRNTWVVEQRRFFDDRAVLGEVFRDESAKPKDVIRKHPELKGSYLKLHAAKLRIEQSTPNLEDRAKVLAGLREAMATSMERGEPLTPVRMQLRAANRAIEAMQEKTPDPLVR
jgi:putative DNA primase/helicase